MKKLSIIPVVGALVLSLCACGKTEPASQVVVEDVTEIAPETEETAETAVGIANPWHDSSEEEAYQLIANGFSAPEGATNVTWSKMDNGDWPLIQMTFELDGNEFTAREQTTGDTYEDLSGMYYEWTAEDTGNLGGWRDGLMEAKFYRYIGEEGYVDVVTWYDVEIGLSYSLSVSAPDLDGFDIQAVAEAMYDPDKQVGAALDAIESYEPMDITGCDTFTQIVDRLEDGAGYANVNIGGEDVLLISPLGVFDNEGYDASIDAEVYYYKDGTPAYAGHVSSGGTAYPLAVMDGLLYAGGNHEVTTYTFWEGLIMTDEDAFELFDTDGSATYFYTCAGLTDASKANSDVTISTEGTVEDDSMLNALYERLAKAEVIEFTKVVK